MSNNGENESVKVKSRYSVETVRQIWNDKTGDRIEVGPDRDGLDLIEIRQIEGSDIKRAEYIIMTVEQAKLLAKVLFATIEDIEKINNEKAE